MPFAARLLLIGSRASHGRVPLAPHETVATGFRAIYRSCLPTVLSPRLVHASAVLVSIAERGREPQVGKPEASPRVSCVTERIRWSKEGSEERRKHEGVSRERKFAGSFDITGAVTQYPSIPGDGMRGGTHSWFYALRSGPCPLAAWRTHALGPRRSSNEAPAWVNGERGVSTIDSAAGYDTRKLERRRSDRKSNASRYRSPPSDIVVVAGTRALRDERSLCPESAV